MSSYKIEVIEGTNSNGRRAYRAALINSKRSENVFTTNWYSTEKRALQVASLFFCDHKDELK